MTENNKKKTQHKESTLLKLQLKNIYTEYYGHKNCYFLIKIQACESFFSLDTVSIHKKNAVAKHREATDNSNLIWQTTRAHDNEAGRQKPQKKNNSKVCELSQSMLRERKR